MTTTTLNAIRAQQPCHDGWTKLLAHLGKSKADDAPLLLLTILDSNDLDDTLWVLQNTKCDERLSRHFGAWCAEQVLHIFEAAMPGDMRPRNAIAAARNDNLDDAAGAAARAAAWDAAGGARAAEGAAEGAAARGAWAAAGAAEGAARAAEGDAAWAAARAAAWAAAWDAAGGAQERQLRTMLTEGF